jgi:hypothetical protein
MIVNRCSDVADNRRNIESNWHHSDIRKTSYGCLGTGDAAAPAVEKKNRGSAFQQQPQP